MNFPSGTQAFAKLEAQGGSDARRVTVRSLQSNAQSRFGRHVSEEPSLRAILGHDQIHAPVFVEVTQRRAALLPVNFDARFLARERAQFAGAVSTQPETPSGVESWHLRTGREKVLAQKNVLVTIPIRVRDVHREHRRDLSLGGQIHRFEFRSAIEKNHRGQSVGAKFARPRWWKTDDVRHAGFAVNLVARKAGMQKRHRFSERIQHPHWCHDARGGVGFRFD